jgi:hypothetical protein
MMLLPSNPLHNQPIRIAPVCIQAAYTVTTAKRVRQILAADLECFPTGADAGAHPFAIDTYVGFKVGGVIHTCLPPLLQRDDGFIFRVDHGGSVHSCSIRRSSISEVPTLRLRSRQALSQRV